MTQQQQTAGGDVRLAGIGKTYGSFTAVHPLDLTVPQGSFFALLGASGCGKTASSCGSWTIRRPPRSRSSSWRSSC
ncbi:hypothetical protein SBADM41S_06026 [Streptomyces badius]